MIESLTPQLLAVTLLLAMAVAAALSLLVSVLVLLVYRRRVLRTMADRTGRAAAWPAPEGTPPRAACAIRPATALAAARHAAGSVAGGGLVFALAFVAAALLAFPTLRTPARALLVLWVCGWPIVPALLVTAPMGRRTRALLIASPLLLWLLLTPLLVLQQALLVDDFATMGAKYWVGIAPPQALGAWLAINLPPTLMWWMFNNRRLRAIGPLVLPSAVVFAAGGLATWLWLGSTQRGTHWIAQAGERTGLAAPALLAAALLAVAAASGVAGWAFLATARRAYRRKQANERSLMLDALWQLFAAWYAMILVLADVAWLAIAPLAFLAGRWTSRALASRRPMPPSTAPALVFLRVFSLGRRSDELFDRVGRYWRHLAPVEMICGPDIVHRTVQPHQLMDFVAGRLRSHFVVDPVSLRRRLAERDLAPDRDRRFRINSIFCLADTWGHVLPSLVGGSVVVLMDLRSLSARHRGCAHEIHHLVAAVPLQRCVLVLDDSTDRDVLRSTLAEAWRAMPPDSPNRHDAGAAPVTFELRPGEASMRELLAHLCRAAAAQ